MKASLKTNGLRNSVQLESETGFESAALNELYRKLRSKGVIGCEIWISNLEPTDGSRLLYAMHVDIT